MEISVTNWVICYNYYQNNNNCKSLLVKISTIEKIKYINAGGL